MNDPLLRDVTVSNFRSIRGRIHVPLDASVVLIHGENGAGKTSLLSAIELALTGEVQSLRRADPSYSSQLLHRSTAEGRVQVNTRLPAQNTACEVLLDQAGALRVSTLERSMATYFSERAYLPQSLLGQLLQIYQESGSGADSPLAKFVGDLLGLDRLDALELGLKPFQDVRNVRKVVENWSQTEIEKSRSEKLRDDQLLVLTGLQESVRLQLEELSSICSELQRGANVQGASIDQLSVGLTGDVDEKSLEKAEDDRRRLDSMLRELSDHMQEEARDGLDPHQDAVVAKGAYESWLELHGKPADDLRRRVESLLPLVALPGDLARFAEESVLMLHSELTQSSARSDQAHADASRLAEATAELATAHAQRALIDEEVSRIPSNSASLSAVLAELSSYVDGETCPLCLRDYSEQNSGTLNSHLHARVAGLSDQAARLLALGRSRSEQQGLIDRLTREIAGLSARRLDERALADLDRRTAALTSALSDVRAQTDALKEGSRLRYLEVSAQRLVSDQNTRNTVLSASRENLSMFAASIGAALLRDDETLEGAARRLEIFLLERVNELRHRLSRRRRGLDLVEKIKDENVRVEGAQKLIKEYMTSIEVSDLALGLAQSLRDQGNAVRNSVDAIRSKIIRREFNERLNRVWRDLFVRLAPNEPFVPAFSIPSQGTSRLQPALVTHHREGGLSGGAPGAMLSAGNLNTAALTLFIALHLASKEVLPWLILDDPVQSMDDIHIAHFAALLRTLSKQHGRQIIIAVHDKQLFEYLRLELSPTSATDSLLTVELSRGPSRDTSCRPQRIQFKEERALQAVA